MNSAIVHVDAPIPVCKQRNEQRKLALAKRRAGVEPNTDAFDYDPDIHYVPDFVYRRYQKAESDFDNQALVLALMPARAYFRIENTGSNLAKYRALAGKLVNDRLAPMIDVSEPLNDFYRRRIYAVEAFVANPQNISANDRLLK